MQLCRKREAKMESLLLRLGHHRQPLSLLLTFNPFKMIRNCGLGKRISSSISSRSSTSTSVTSTSLLRRAAAPTYSHRSSNLLCYSFSTSCILRQASHSNQSQPIQHESEQSILINPNLSSDQNNSNSSIHIVNQERDKGVPWVNVDPQNQRAVTVTWASGIEST